MSIELVLIVCLIAVVALILVGLSISFTAQALANALLVISKPLYLMQANLETIANKALTADEMEKYAKAGVIQSSSPYAYQDEYKSQSLDEGLKDYSEWLARNS